MLVATERGCSFFSFDRDGNDLVVESAGRNGPRGAGLGRESELVLLLARDFVLFGEKFGGLAHHHFRQRTEKPVAIHAVHEFLMPEAISPAGLIQQIRNP